MSTIGHSSHSKKMMLTISHSNMKSDYNVCEADRYITIDDYGKLKLVVLVDIKSKKVDNFTRRIELVETIK